MKKTDNKQQTRPGNFAPLRYNSGLKKFDFEYQGLTYEIPEDEALRMAEFVVNSLKAPRTRPITDMTEEEGRELAKMFNMGYSQLSVVKHSRWKEFSFVDIHFDSKTSIQIYNDGTIASIGVNMKFAPLTDYLRERGFEV